MEYISILLKKESRLTAAAVSYFVKFFVTMIVIIST